MIWDDASEVLAIAWHHPPRETKLFASAIYYIGSLPFQEYLKSKLLRPNQRLLNRVYGFRHLVRLVLQP